MSRWVYWLKETGRFTSFLLFQILILFWCVKVGYAVHGYLTKGRPGLREAVLRHMANPYDPREWTLHPAAVRWDIIALRYLAIALLTVLFGLFSRDTIRKYWMEFWHRPDSGQPDS
jgi:hypothetical protein